MTHTSITCDASQWEDAHLDLLHARCRALAALESGEPEAYLWACWDADDARERMRALEAANGGLPIPF